MRPTHAALLPALVLAASASAATYYVDDSAPSGGDGLAWASAFSDLRLALAAAGAGDEVRVAQGTYKPDAGTGNRHMFFTPASGVSLVGGFAGLAGIEPDLRDPEAYRTILSGDLNGDDGPNFTNRSDNTTNVLYVWSKDGVVIDGFTVRGGQADLVHSGASGMAGGGLQTAFSEVTVRNCVFIDNRSLRGGGALALLNTFGPVQRIENCRFIGNYSLNDGAQGGGVAYLATHARPEFVNCVFIANSAANTGGAILNASTTALVANCTLANNSANAGGAIHANGGQITLRNCILWGNSGVGGAELAQVWTSFGTAVVENCSLPALSTYAGSGNMIANPNFPALAGADGVLGTIDDDARPHTESAVIDAGDAAHVPAGVLNDIAGGARITGAAVDLGAYETPCPGDTNADAIVNFTDLNLILSDFNTAGYGRAGDVDGDGDVDFADLNLVLSGFNSAC